MLYFKKSSDSNSKYYLILTVFASIAYWPLTLNVFSLKNDAITYFLPWRYHISTAIQNGYFPFLVTLLIHRLAFTLRYPKRCLESCGFCHIPIYEV